MMRTLLLFFACQIMWLCSAMPALANCAIIDRLTQITNFQLQLARSGRASLSESELYFLQIHLRALPVTEVLRAVESTQVPQRHRVFQQLLNDTATLIPKASESDQISVRQHFLDPDIRENLQRAQSHLRALHCTDDISDNSVNGYAPATSIDEDGRFGSSSPVALKDTQVTKPFGIDYKVTGITVFGVAVTVVALIQLNKFVAIWTRRTRRRRKRRPAHFETRARLNSRETPVKLIDISGHGTKIVHYTDPPPSVKSEIEIMIAGTWRQGVVMWSNVNYAGVQFKKSIRFLAVLHVQDNEFELSAAKHRK
ncbi:PilZ domain-containing protein [Loktanella agnita]|uniref:PilZ domain-containing protein n=1 Tax=Loktanella agnita TaxID=287097 RepID=UPI003986FDB1